ncbi:hypothetical protein QJS10_CPA09g01276 [Acorus calamus]|uniref:SWIM-type domain-containing protein n=1 Tax=Acorus calamus TaxID=4465 RepID=A0AAV9E409_ACOCL|nr:hypothetical protein QJS10_CPA09g01276 [Acorus calamus]
MKDHSCTSVNKVGNEIATSDWLAKQIVPALHKTPEIGASKLKMAIEQRYNLSLPYGRVLASRGKAVELIYGKASESFRLVPELHKQMMLSNPGSIIRYLLDVDHSFMRFFEKGNYIVRRSTDKQAEVVGPQFACVVNLEDRTCSCRAWQVTGLPCEYAAAFITSVRGLDILDYVDDCYSVQRFRAAYAIPVGGMPSRELWDKVVLPYEVGPPKTIRPRGRPKKKRIRDPNEKRKGRHKCTRCNTFGHQKNTCKNPIGESSSQGSARVTWTPTFVNNMSSSHSAFHESSGPANTTVNLDSMTLQSQLKEFQSTANIGSFQSQSSMCLNSSIMGGSPYNSLTSVTVEEDLHRLGDCGWRKMSMSRRWVTSWSWMGEAYVRVLVRPRPTFLVTDRRGPLRPQGVVKITLPRRTNKVNHGLDKQPVIAYRSHG